MPETVSQHATTNSRRSFSFVRFAVTFVVVGAAALLVGAGVSSVAKLGSAAGGDPQRSADVENVSSELSGSTAAAGSVAPTTVSPTSTTAPERLDIEFLFHFEEDVFSAGEQAAFAAAVEQSVRAFPDLERPETITAVAFHDVSFLTQALGQQFRDDWVASNGVEEPEFYGAGMAWASLSTFAVRAQPGMLAQENIAHTIYHETYHLVQLHDTPDIAALPLAVVEGAARFAESFVTWHAGGEGETLEARLEEIWGGESRRAACFLASDFPVAEISDEMSENEVRAAVDAEREAIRELSCDPFEPGAQRAVRAALDSPATYENYIEWAGFLYTWTRAQGGDPSMFLSDLWTAADDVPFAAAWDATFGVPYAEFELWVADLVAADQTAWDAQSAVALQET